MTREIELYEIPEVLEKAEILDDSQLGKYNDSFAGWNERAKATLGKMRSICGESAGSSSFIFVRFHNSGALPDGVRLSTRQDLEKAIQIYAKKNGGANFTAGIYSDVGVALRTAGDTYEINGVRVNDALAKKLTEQLKHRGIALNKGVLIPFPALKDSESADEHYGITWDLNDSATNETIRDLREFKWDWSRDDGLACAFRSGRDWSSNYRFLDRSLDSGRVVVVRAVGTPQKILEQKLDGYAIELKKSKAQYIEGLSRLKAKIDAEIQVAQ